MTTPSEPARSQSSRSKPPTKERVTVSLSAGLAHRLKAQVRASGADSVSEYVESALEQRLQRDIWWARWVAVMGEPDEAAMEYARQSLLRRPNPPRSA